MALTKAQLSLVSVSTLGVAAGGYTAQLAAFNSQKEAAAFIQAEGLLNGGTNAEFVNTVAGNLNNVATAQQKAAFLKAIDDGASRSDATVDFANTLLVSNGSIANVNKAIASTSTSMDLNALKAEITPVDSAQTVTFATQNTDGTAFLGNGVKANLGKAEIENGAGKISADFTFELKDQANVFGANNGAPTSATGEFTGAFLSPMLERAAAVQSDSAIYLKLLDGFALRDNFQSIERLATNGIGFSIDGVSVVVADKLEDGDQGAIYKAKNYVELKDAITARLAELASGQGLPAGADAATYAKLATFTVELGSNFSKANQAGDQVTGTELVIKDASGSILVPQGFSTYGGIHPHTDLNSINELTNQAPSTSTQLISTNIDAENVGYGSQGATLNIAGQSASNKGVEEFKVTATKDVWFTRLESRDLANNQHLQEVSLQSGSNGYFRVGTQKDSKDLVVDLVDQNFGVKGGGLVDVIKLDAAAAGSVAVNAFISDAVIARNFNLQDTDANYKTDDVQVNYSLTGGNDVLQLAVASEVVAYADTQVNIVAGAGNDLVHLKIVGNEADATTGKVANAGAGTYGNGWLANQQLNDNIKVDAAAGNNTIWTEGSGNVRITTGNGNDTIYADNSGRTTLVSADAKAKLDALGMGADVNALYVFNAENTNIGDILSNTANGTDGKANTAQVFQTFKNTVSVTFKGIESAKHIEIKSTDYTTSTLQINQAIKEAINNDPTLNKLIVAKEFPGNVLVVESLIDGTQVIGDLTVNFVTPAAAGTLPAALNPGQLVLGANDLAEAGKKYAPAGTATPAPTTQTAMDAFVTGAINTIYTTNKGFATDGPGGAGTPATYTIDLAGAVGTIAGETVLLDNGSGTPVLAYTTVGAAETDVTIAAGIVAAGTIVIDGVTYNITAGTGTEVVLTATTNVAETDPMVITNTGLATAPTTTSFVPTQNGTVGTGTSVAGTDSTAHSDNVINAGAGNDVIVLGTGASSNDTVVLTGTFGKTTIVNFDDTGASDVAANGGDLLDFRTYLDANYGATTSAQVSVSTATSGTVAANAITVINFDQLQSGATGGIAATDKLSSVTAAQLSFELNADFDAAAAATKNVFLIQNDNSTALLDNLGEYLVVTTTSTADTTTGVNFNDVTIVGTMDFGAAQTFAGNIVGFDGVIV